MEGRLVELTAVGQGKVNSGNNTYGILTIYKLPADITVNTTIQFELKLSARGNYYAVFVSLVDRNVTMFNTED